MKYISKINEHPRVTQWKMAAQPPTWEKLNKKPKIKKLVRKTLLEEQGFICCYCQRRIHESEIINGQKAITAEIEHITSRHECDQLNQPLLKIAHTNLIASCDGNQRRNNSNIPLNTRHCNNHRGNDLLLISPLMLNCERAFSYKFNGEIVGNTPDAVETINKLNLTVLTSTRISKIIGVLPLEVIESITTTEIQTLINHYSNKSNVDNDGEMKFPEYSGVIINLLGQLNGN